MPLLCWALLRTTDKHFEKAIETPRAGENVGELTAIQSDWAGSSSESTNENRPEKPGENHPELCCAQEGYPLGESNPCPLAENQIS